MSLSLLSKFFYVKFDWPTPKFIHKHTITLPFLIMAANHELSPPNLLINKRFYIRRTYLIRIKFQSRKIGKSLLLHVLIRSIWLSRSTQYNWSKIKWAKDPFVLKLKFKGFKQKSSWFAQKASKCKPRICHGKLCQYHTPSQFVSFKNF